MHAKTLGGRTKVTSGGPSFFYLSSSPPDIIMQHKIQLNLSYFEK